MDFSYGIMCLRTVGRKAGQAQYSNIRLCWIAGMEIMMIVGKLKRYLFGAVFIMLLMALCTGCSNGEKEEDQEELVETDIFRIPVPADIKDMLNFEIKDNRDVIVLLKESETEAGRYCAVSYEEAERLKEEKEITFIGGYEENEAQMKATEGVPGTDSNSETTYITTDESELEPAAATEADVPEEISITYIPSEEISTTYIPLEECYVFIPGAEEGADSEERDALIKLREKLALLCSRITVKETKTNETVAHTFTPAGAEEGNEPENGVAGADGNLTASEDFPYTYEGAVNDIEYTFHNPCIASTGISAAFEAGIQPDTGEEFRHEGVDYAAQEGAKIMAAADGTVYAVSHEDETYGKFIVLLHQNGQFTYYCGCMDIFVEPGAQVERGDAIGTVGKIPASAGYHLHFALSQNGEFMNPEEYME